MLMKVGCRTNFRPLRPHLEGAAPLVEDSWAGREAACPVGQPGLPLPRMAEYRRRGRRTSGRWIGEKALGPDHPNVAIGSTTWGWC